MIYCLRMARMDYVDGQLDFFLEGLCFLNVLVIICPLAASTCFGLDSRRLSLAPDGDDLVVPEGQGEWS